MTKKITLKQAKTMTSNWFQVEWLSTFNSYIAGSPDPKRLEDLMFATKHVWKGNALAEVLDFPSGNRGTVVQMFDCYRSGLDYLEDLLKDCAWHEAEYQ